MSITKVRSCYRVFITSNEATKNVLLEVKTITKSPENGIAESVKSCNLHLHVKTRKKFLVAWFSDLPAMNATAFNSVLKYFVKDGTF